LEDRLSLDRVVHFLPSQQAVSTRSGSQEEETDLEDRFQLDVPVLPIPNRRHTRTSLRKDTHRTILDRSCRLWSTRRDRVEVGERRGRIHRTLARSSGADRSFSHSIQRLVGSKSLLTSEDACGAGWGLGGRVGAKEKSWSRLVDAALSVHRRERVAHKLTARHPRGGIDDVEVGIEEEEGVRDGVDDI
jgi:hypothetical protein